MMSRPTWARGLKHLRYLVLHKLGVAPHVGAWIETPYSEPGANARYVAPHVGAWIETSP